MSLVKETFLICDKCGESFGADNRWRSAKEQRKNAMLSGWACGGATDLCSKCRPKRKDGQPHKIKANRKWIKTK